MSAGLNSIYPKTNYELADKILECVGCIISEYEPDVDTNYSAKAIKEIKRNTIEK